jgi:hypothetical protein
MMQRPILLAAASALAVLPAFAGPTGPLPAGLRGTAAQFERPQLVWWHAGGTTAYGNHWHAGGTGGYGAYHGGYAGGYAHGWADSNAYHGYYARPVPVTPWYHPAATAAAVAGTAAVVGGIAGAATASAVANAAPKPAGQPTTVINNYYD